VNWAQAASLRQREKKEPKKYNTKKKNCNGK